MERIGVGELRQHASRYLRRVKAGETVEVTERGKLIALLVPPEPAVSARDRLVASGRLIPASQPFRIPQSIDAGPGVLSSEAILDDIREERI